MMKPILFAAALSLGACSLTSQERTDLVDSGMTLAIAGVEMLHAMGDDPFSASPKALAIADTVCSYMDAGEPLIVAVINIALDRFNATENVDPVTAEEFRAVLDDACKIVALIFALDDETA